MKIYADIRSLGSLEGPLHLAIGVFDGVHLGHQAVIRQALRSSEQVGGEVAVVTFDPHPITVLAPQSAPRLLTATHHKTRLLGEILGVKTVLTVPFDLEFAGQSGSVFVRQLCDAAAVGSISVGRDFQFGKDRSGNVELLERLSEELNFQLNAADIVEIEGTVVSSTKIRRAVEVGNFDTARLLLGRSYTVLGTVTEGRQMGRTIGFPTANLSVHCEQLPPTGVYAVRAKYKKETFGGVANLGFRPTVEDGETKRLLEVHIIDFSGDLYGDDIEVEFVRFIRGEKKFEGLEQLKEQIAADSNEARATLSQ